MHLKRFRGRTVADALEAARQTLGADALVLGTRLAPLGGWRGLLGAREVEITAATEREVSEDRPARQADRHSTRATAGTWHAQLAATGLDPAVVDEVAADFTGRRSAAPVDVRQALTTWTATIAAADDELARVDVFVGPPGAGKTTTIAKIAAQARVKNGRRLCLISADGFRVGAIEQLRLYAEIIGAPFVAVRTPEQLAQAVAAGTAPILVDTAGRSARDGHPRELMSLIGAMPGVRVHLVVPAGCTPMDLRRLLDAHAEIGPHRVVLTKVDEGGSVAPLAGLLRARDLRVSYLGTGQRVPDDLQVATPAVLAAALVGDSIQAPGHAA